MKLTRADRKILQILQEDGKISNVDLAERVGLSPSPCLREANRGSDGANAQSYRGAGELTDGC